MRKLIQSSHILDKPIILAAPGQIRKEYEEQKKRSLFEIQKQHAAEVKASEDLIKKIVEEESLEETNLRRDEQFARELDKEINCIGISKRSDIKKIEALQKKGPLDTFLHNTNSDSFKNNSLCIKSFTKEEPTKSKKDINKKECETRILCQDNKSKYSKNTITNDRVIKNGSMNNATKSTAGTNNKTNIYDDESRYFKPIDFKNVPSSKKVPIVRVPAKLNKTCTVSIG